jgi:Tol biopolymer transport system component
LLKLGLSSTSLPGVDPPPPPQPPQQTTRAGRYRRVWKAGLLAGGTIVVVFLVALTLFLPADRGTQPQVIRFSLALRNAIDFAVSPDGRRIAFTALNEDGQTLLWVHPMDSFHDTALAETDGASGPFWSPDSRHIGFFTRGKLMRVDSSLGAAETLTDAPAGKSGTWSADGVIVFERGEPQSLYRVADRGGTTEPVTSIDRSDNRREIAHRWPQFLPDGRHVIYTAITSNGEGDGVFVSSLDSGEAKKLMSGLALVAYAAESLLLARNGMLLIQPFDFRTLEFSADARPLRFAEQVDRFSASANGVLAYRKRELRPPSPIVWLDRSGSRSEIAASLTASGPFSVSPDGRMIAISRAGDIWVFDIARNAASRFTFDPAEDTFPVWSPDGTRIAFLSHRGNRRAIYQKLANAATNEELLFENPLLSTVEAWSPDGRFLAYTERNDKRKSTVSILPLSGERKPLAVQSAFNLQAPSFSPDARHLAYVSDESGKDEIYIESFPPGGSKWLVSVNGGTNPKWRKDGRELFYISPQKELMAVPLRVRGEQSVELGTPVVLFPISGGPYDITADGRFVLAFEEHERPSFPIDVVINWPSEL